MIADSWCSVSCEREHVAVAGDQLAGLRRATARPRRCRARRATTSCSATSSSSASRRRASSACASSSREVHRRERVAAQRQLELSRQRVGQAARRAAASAPRTSSRRRVDGICSLAGYTGAKSAVRSRLADVVALHVEAVAAELAAQPDRRAGRQLLEQPRLVEERGADLTAAVVTDDRGHERAPPPAGGRERALDYSTFDRDFALGLTELRDRDLRRRRSRSGAARAAAGHARSAMPNVRSRFASVAPTPGSVATSSASSRCGGVQPRGRGHSFWTTTCETRVHTGHRRHRDRG